MQVVLVLKVTIQRAEVEVVHGTEIVPVKSINKKKYKNILFLLILVIPLKKDINLIPRQKVFNKMTDSNKKSLIYIL